jgi:hypothetical protein
LLATCASNSSALKMWAQFFSERSLAFIALHAVTSKQIALIRMLFCSANTYLYICTVIPIHAISSTTQDTRRGVSFIWILKLNTTLFFAYLMGLYVAEFL